MMRIRELARDVRPFLEDLEGILPQSALVSVPFLGMKGEVEEDKHWYFEQGGDVLLVAHSDTVQKPSYHGILKDRVYASGLDDRLGCFLALELFNMDKSFDVVITDKEEICDSTIADMKPEDIGKYRMVVELDRQGTDFVHYDLAGRDLIEAMSKYRRVGHGSFSDICLIDNPICGCINVGIGYYLAHDKFSYCVLDEVNQAIEDVLSLVQDTKDQFFPAPIKRAKKEVVSWYGNKFGLLDEDEEYWLSRDLKRSYK